MLLEAGSVDVNVKDNRPRTAVLMMASTSGREDVVCILLKEDRVNVNSRYDHGRGALTMASQDGHESDSWPHITEGRQGRC